MVETRNILLVGRTGQGKSSVANTLVNKEENFSENGKFLEDFKEGKFGVSETKEIKVGEFECDGIKYRIIDTVGFGDTSLKPEVVASKMIEGCQELKDGLSQILFIIGGKFTLEEIKIYNIIKKAIFDEGITEYTTIVRTKFSAFRSQEECEKDHDLLSKENRKSSKLIKSCNKVIHIDNPSSDDRDFNEKEIAVNKQRKKESRDILMELLKCCGSVYKPKKLELIGEKFKEYVSKDKDLQSEFELVEVLKRQIEELENQGLGQFFGKKMDKLTLKAAQVTGQTAKELAEITKLALRAVIEVSSHCKTM